MAISDKSINRRIVRIDTLGEAQIFTTLYALSGFWQVPLVKEDRSNTAFTSQSELYEYTRMTFGLTNEPSTFQRAQDINLARYKWKIYLVYINDVLVF